MGKFVSSIHWLKTKFGTTIQRMHSDNGTKFTKGSLPVYLSKAGILRETICVDTPQ